jgi:hypothetical protein
MATCPICKSAAEEIEPGFFDGKTFRCENHGEFDVVDTVLQLPLYMDQSQAEWELALKRAAAAAKSVPGKRPRITTYCFETAA